MLNIEIIDDAIVEISSFWGRTIYNPRSQGRELYVNDTGADRGELLGKTVHCSIKRN